MTVTADKENRTSIYVIEYEQHAKVEYPALFLTLYVTVSPAERICSLPGSLYAEVLIEAFVWWSRGYDSRPVKEFASPEVYPEDSRITRNVSRIKKI